jgi:signal transduction histidine kinase
LENAELTPDLRRHLLLFFKEAVTNIARHAGASEVDLSIAAAHGELRLSIRDNGRGFDTGVAAGGQGLRSLRFRAAEMRAELTIESTADRGTRIELQIPQRVRRLAKRSVV